MTERDDEGNFVIEGWDVAQTGLRYKLTPDGKGGSRIDQSQIVNRVMVHGSITVRVDEMPSLIEALIETLEGEE